jgi:hypothetical protein
MGSLAFVPLLVTLGLPDEFMERIPQCDMRSEQTQRLIGFHETQIDWRLLPSGTLLELWSSDAGSWTMLQTTPTGVSCILQIGEGAPSFKT